MLRLLVFGAIISFFPSIYSYNPKQDFLVNYEENQQVNVVPKLDYINIAHKSMMEEEADPTWMERIRQEIRRRLAIYKSEVEYAHELGWAAGTEGSLDNETDTIQLQHDQTSRPNHTKTRRAIITASNVLPGRRRRNITQHFETDGSKVVSRIYRPQPQPFDNKLITDILAVNVKGDSYIVAYEKSSPDGEGELAVYKIVNGLNPREIIRQSAHGATSINAVQISGQYYFIVAKYKEVSQDPKNTGSPLYHINFAKAKLTKVQTINTDYVRSVVFWKGAGDSETNDIFLGVVPELKDTPKGTSPAVEVLVYQWAGAHLDATHSVPALFPQAISFATIYSHGYLAVANFKDHSGSTNVYSEIFTYNYKIAKFLSVQKILTHGAMDIQHFTLTGGHREEHFLAIANYGKTDEQGNLNHHVKTRILKFARERFMPFQSFDTVGAMQVLPVQVDQYKLLLAVLDQRGIQIYQYNGYKYIKTFTFRLSEEDIPLHSVRLRSLTFENQPYLVIASQKADIKGGIYALEFEQKGHNKLSHDVGKWCLSKLIAMQAVSTPALVERAQLAPKVTDREIILESSLSFAQPIKATEMFTKKLTLGEMIFDAQLSKELAEQEARLRALKNEATEIQLALGQKVTRDTTQFIDAPIQFDSMKYLVESFKADNVVTTTLNDVNVNELLANIIRLDGNYEFSRVTVSEITAKGKTSVNELNGLPLSAYALKSSPKPQTFTATNTFEFPAMATQGFQVDGLVDGVNFQNENVDFLLLNSDQTFKTMNLRDSITRNLVADVVNGVKVKEYMDDAVPKDGPATISGRKEFNFVSVKNWQASKINGVDIDEFFKRGMPVSASQHIFTGFSTKFDFLRTKSVEVTNDLLNDKISIAKDLISIKTGSFELGSAEFLSDTKVDTFGVNKALNDIRVIDGKLDLVLKSSPNPQVIANKKLNAIELHKDSHAEGHVDNVMLNGWSHNLNIELNQNHLQFGELHIKDGSLSLHGGMHIEPGRSTFLHGTDDVSRILANALRLDAAGLPETFRGKLKFDSVEVQEDTSVSSTVNGLRTSDWVLRDPGDLFEVRISAPKIFTGDLNLLAPSTTRKLFGTTEKFSPNILAGFGDLLIDGQDQTIRGTTIFNSVLEVDNLDCPDLDLNGVRFSDLMTTSTDQEVKGKVSFTKDVKITNEFLVTGSVNVLGTVNERDLTADILDTLRTSSSTPQTMLEKITFEDEFRAKNIIAESTIGGHNVETLLDNIVQKDHDGAQVIQGSITFAKPVEIDTLDFSGTLNGIKSEEWGQRLLLNTGSQTIKTATTFKKSVKVASVSVPNGEISNFNFVRFASEVSRIDQNDQSLGVCFFENEISTGSKNNVLLGPNAKVNGFDLKKDLLFKSSSLVQTVTGSKTFNNPTTIRGNLVVKSFGDFNYEQAAAFALGKTESTDNFLIKGNLQLTDEPFFSESFNGEPWSKMIEGIWLIGKDARFIAPVEFTSGLTAKKGIRQLSGTLNEVDLNAFVEEYFSKSKDQAVTGSITFGQGVTIDELHVKSITIKNGKVNGIDLEKFRDSVILNGVDQRIKVHMVFVNLHCQNLILEDGVRISGLDFSHDVMTLHGDNFVTQELSFDDLNVQELFLQEGTTLNGINLEDWKASAVTLEENEIHVLDDVRFSKAAFPGGVKVLGLVNNLKYSKDTIFTLNDDQEISGSFTFSQNPGQVTGAFIATNGFEVTGLFNGLDLKETIEALVRDDGSEGPLIVTGEKTFHQSLFADSVKAEGLFQANDLDAIIQDLQVQSHFSPPAFDFSLDDKYQELTEQANSLLEVTSRRAVLFEDYNLVDQIGIFDIRNILTFNIFEVQRILFAIQTSEITQNILSGHYDPVINFYVPDSFFRVEIEGVIKDWTHFKSEDDHFIFVLINSPSEEKRAQITNAIELNGLSRSNIGKSNKPSKGFLLKLPQLSRDSEKEVVIAQLIFGDAFGFMVKFEKFESDDTSVPCLGIIVNDEEGSKVYILSFPKSNLEITQTIATENPTLISALTGSDFKTLLMIANSNKVEGDEGDGETTGVIDVWAHGKGESNFIKIDCIPTVNLVSMDACGGFNNKAYLAVASAPLKNSNVDGTLSIYGFSQTRNQFVKQMSAIVYDPIAVEFQRLDVSKEIFLYVLSRSSQRNIQIYGYRGASGWIREHTLTVEGAQQLELTSFSLNNEFFAQFMGGAQHIVSIHDLEFNGLASRRELTVVTNTTKTTSFKSRSFIL